MSSVRWHFFVFRNSVEKFCISWAFPLIECVAVWALKLPVVSAPLRSLHNRSPPDFLQLIPTYSKPTRHKVFLRNYWNPKEPATNICHSQIIPIFFYLSLITKRKNAYINLKSMLYCYRQLNMDRIGNAQSSGMITNNT